MHTPEVTDSVMKEKQLAVVLWIVTVVTVYVVHSKITRVLHKKKTVASVHKIVRSIAAME